jgi:hypothetical protein
MVARIPVEKYLDAWLLGKSADNVTPRKGFTMSFAAVSGHRAVEPETAIVVGSIWRIMTSPDEFEGGAVHQNDHADKIIWLSPSLSDLDRPQALQVALQRAARQAVVFLAEVE